MGHSSWKSFRPLRAVPVLSVRLQAEALEDRTVPNGYIITPSDLAWMEQEIARGPVEGFANEWIVGFDDQALNQQPAILDQLSVLRAEPVRYFEDAFRWQFNQNANYQGIVAELRTLQSNGTVDYFYPSLPVTGFELAFTPDDPLFDLQWHLQNSGQGEGIAGEDINILDAWDSYRGTGVTVGIIDGGTEHTHPDLIDNRWTNPDDPNNGSDDDGNGLVDDQHGWDFVEDDNEPSTQGTDNAHGTLVAGVTAGRGDNGLGIAGVGFEATIVPLRLIPGEDDPDITTDDVANALSYRVDVVDVFNNSWGPAYPGYTEPIPAVAAAIQQGATTGRNGLGTIYVWAAGNDRSVGSDTNYAPSMTNSRYTITVAALDNSGRVTSYSNPGASLLISAPGGVGPFNDPGTVIATDNTGDFGFNDGSGLNGQGDYTGAQGTSFAAPVISGVVTLLLEANPTLSYRDVQQILATTARQNDPSNPSWFQNGAGRWVSHDYGYGVVDTLAAISAAENWQNLPPEMNVSTGPINVNLAIPDNNPTGVEFRFDVTQNVTIEWAELEFSTDHTFADDLRIELVSPAGSVSVLADTRQHAGDSYANATFGTHLLRGEQSIGTWTLRVTDGAAQDQGTISTIALNLSGTDPDFVPPPPGDQVVANDDVYTTPFEVTLTVASPGILTNDISPSGASLSVVDPASIALIQGQGTLTVNADGSFTYTPTVGFSGTASFVYTATDGTLVSTLATVTIEVLPDGTQPPPGEPPEFIQGPQGLLPVTDSQNFNRPIVVSTSSPDDGVVKMVNTLNGAEQINHVPYGTGVIARGTAGDLNADGVAELITVAGPGGGAHVKIFDGNSNQEVFGFFAYDPAFLGGAFVAAGDVNGDGFDDVVVGAGPGGGPHVRVFDGRLLMTTQRVVELLNFMAYADSFRGGVNVATGDVNGDGRSDLIVGAGPGGGPHVRVIDALSRTDLQSFLAYDPNFRGGVNVAAGDLNGDGLDEVVLGPGIGGSAHIRVVEISTMNDLMTFMAFTSIWEDPDQIWTAGARVGVADSDGDGIGELVIAAGPGEVGRVNSYHLDGEELLLFFPFGTQFLGGIEVG